MVYLTVVGILVHGNNHFIVRGPLPAPIRARQLVQHWSIINIAARTPTALEKWTISTKEFRENLEWAVLCEGDGATQPAVAQLLEELEARGITIHRDTQYWLGEE